MRKLEREAMLENAAAKQALEEAKKAAADARKAALEAAQKVRQDDDQRRQAADKSRSDAQWLQTIYPLELANKLLAWRKALSADQVADLATAVRDVLRTQRCHRTTCVPHLWNDDHSLTVVIGNGVGEHMQRRPVRCPKDFEWLLFRQAWAAERRDDAGWMLMKLIDDIMPEGASMFRRRYTAGLLLSMNDFVVQKAFVHATILLSKWLGADRFPVGIHVWPPGR